MKVTIITKLNFNDMIENLNEIIGDIRSRYELKRISSYLQPDKYDTANSLFASMASAICGKDYDCRNTASIINKLVHWTYNTSVDDIDCTKGFLIRGETGRGKTLLMYAMKEFLQYDSHWYIVGGKRYRLEMSIASARNIAFEYAQQSEENVIARYSRIPLLCIDDLGSEPMLSSNYGNKCSVVSEILANRAETKLLTFATTNVARLSECYDDRIISRMHSLFNSVNLSHETDYRKLK